MDDKVNYFGQLMKFFKYLLPFYNFKQDKTLLNTC